MLGDTAKTDPSDADILGPTSNGLPTSTLSTSAQPVSGPSSASATSGPPRPPFHRSRTDSLISYTPTTVAEAPGATFYISRKGEIDYVVLLKVRNQERELGNCKYQSILGWGICHGWV